MLAAGGTSVFTLYEATDEGFEKSIDVRGALTTIDALDASS